MNLIEPSFDPTVFTKNRERLLKHRVGQALFDEVVFGSGPAGPGDRRGVPDRAIGVAVVGFIAYAVLTSIVFALL